MQHIAASLRQHKIQLSYRCTKRSLCLSHAHVTWNERFFWQPMPLNAHPYHTVHSKTSKCLKQWLVFIKFPINFTKVYYYFQSCWNYSTLGQFAKTEFMGATVTDFYRPHALFCRQSTGQSTKWNSKHCYQPGNSSTWTNNWRHAPCWLLHPLWQLSDDSTFQMHTTD